MKKRIPILIGAACLAQLLTLQPAQAQTDHVESSIAVSYSDLDLNSEAGANVMLGRLRQAARRVCSSDFDRDLTRGRAERECMRNAMRDAVAAANTVAVERQYARSQSGVTTIAQRSSVQFLRQRRASADCLRRSQPRRAPGPRGAASPHRERHARVLRRQPLGAAYVARSARLRDGIACGSGRACGSSRLHAIGSGRNRWGRRSSGANERGARAHHVGLGVRRCADACCRDRRQLVRRVGHFWLRCMRSARACC
jgi:UrcA family protein